MKLLFQSERRSLNERAFGLGPLVLGLWFRRHSVPTNEPKLPQQATAKDQGTEDLRPKT